MNVRTVVAVGLIAGSALLGGCASMHSKGDPSALTPGDNPSNAEMDAAYVAAVDRTATDSGVQVIWVNPPDKHSHSH